MARKGLSVARKGLGTHTHTHKTLNLGARGGRSSWGRGGGARNNIMFA